MCWPVLGSIGLLVLGDALQAQEVRVPLNGAWSFRQAGTIDWLPAQVPGLVHTDLIRLGLIPDPYAGNNVDSVQWIEREDWVYRRAFNASSELLAKDHIHLVFRGLDTFAEVYLNDSLLGRADNMFRTWRWPVGGKLRTGANQIEVRFRSTIAAGMERRERHGIRLPHDSDPSGVAPHVRKAAYQFGWDFAPRLVSCGIWQEVELHAWDIGRIESVKVQSWSETDGHRLRIVPRLDVPRDVRVQIRVSIDGVVVHEHGMIRRGGRIPLHDREVQHTIRDPNQWWPTGHGEQHLYRLTVELLHKGQVISSWSERVGLREIELVQRKDSIGRSFHFEVNGRPIFAKGCNLVPPDMFLPRAGDSAWVALVAHMQDAHMNMVRVWAGGVYPPDAFFHACDTAGILVWQDLMLAYMPPNDRAFRLDLREEIKGQLERVHHHACLAVLCGNNELQVAWKNWGWTSTYELSRKDQHGIRKAYRRIFEQEATDWAGHFGLNYTTTSPLSNWGNAAGLRSGSLHYWGVWHGDSTFASYGRNVGRFVSEYGFQSWPDSAWLATWVDPSHLFLGSPDLDRRQGSYKGNTPILDAIERELGVQPSSFGEFCEASREVQAIGLEQAAKAHVAAHPHCMGTLLWQLNDVWPAPSWSIIDHSGRRKPAFGRIATVYRSAP